MWWLTQRLIAVMNPYFMGRSTSQNRMMRFTIGRVLGAVDEGLVEHESLAVAPDAFHAVDQDPAFVRIGGDQSEVIAQRAGERIAMRAELAAGRQHGEHCAMDVGIEFKSSTVFGHSVRAEGRKSSYHLR